MLCWCRLCPDVLEQRRAPEERFLTIFLEKNDIDLTLYPQDQWDKYPIEGERVNLLAAKMAEPNMSLPAPRIGVEEISSVSNRAVEIQERARF